MSDLRLQAMRRAEIDELLGRFRFDHLPGDLQAVSRPFARLALHLADTLPDAESSGEIVLALQHLMSSKDAAVRHAAGALPGRQAQTPDDIRGHLRQHLEADW